MKLQGIQNLRAIAAIAVVFDHAAAMANFDKYYGQAVPFYHFFTAGALGVNLFFLISGFIIVVSSFEQKYLKPKRTLGSFLKARAIRIIPMMWLAIASYAALRFLGRGAFEASPYFNALLLIPFGDYDPNNIWTLRHEAIFYVIFGLCFLSRSRSAFWFGTWAVLPFIVFATTDYFGHPADSITEEIVKNVFSPFNLLFATGSFIGYVYLRYPTHFSVEAWRLLPNTIRTALPLMVFTGVMANFGGDFKSLDVIIWTTPIFAALVVLGALQTADSSRLISYLGNASFAIYLFHPHFESATLGVLSRLHPDMPISAAVAITGTLAIGAGCAIYSFIEEPITAKLNRLIRKGN